MHGDGIESRKMVVHPSGSVEVRGHASFGCLSGHSRKRAGSLLAILAPGFAVSLCHHV